MLNSEGIGEEGRSYYAPASAFSYRPTAPSAKSFEDAAHLFAVVCT